MEYTKEAVRVGPSRQGQGVFSLRWFTTGDLIGPIQGEIVEDPQYSSDYCMELGDQSLEPAAPFRFLTTVVSPTVRWLPTTRMKAEPPAV